jgi:hypothetical protein
MNVLQVKCFYCLKLFINFFFISQEIKTFFAKLSLFNTLMHLLFDFRSLKLKSKPKTELNESLI